MLFNKHAETKQRFGIRKLTIGATSVLLSTLFLTINNSQKAQAATAENGSSTTNSNNYLEQKDGKSTSKQNVTDQSVTDQSAGNAQNSSPANAEEKTADLGDKATIEEVTDRQDDGQDEGKAAVEKVRAASMKFAAKPATPVLSQDSHDKRMSLSINSPELSNKTYDPEVITLNATSVHAGDKIVIKVKKGSAYDLDNENLPIANVNAYDQGEYRVFELDINNSGKFAYKITAKKKNNYQSQPAPMPDTGVTDKDIQWSINDQNQASLSFKQTIIPQLTADTLYVANSDGRKNDTIHKLIPNQDYNFIYIMGENNGLVQDNSYMANVIDSAVNYRSTITIPVPKNFLLNYDATIKANTEQKLIDDNSSNPQITIKQAGMGQDIVITVPKGQSSQNFVERPSYTLIGKFVYDQDKLPEHDTIVEASGESAIDQTYTSDGQKIYAYGGKFKATIAGSDYQPEIGDLNISAKGAINSGQLLLDSNPTNDPRVVNWFSYKNDNNDIKDAKIQLNLADGLYVTGIGTPKNLGTTYNNIGNISSYTYEMTLANGKKVSGTVTAGDTVKSTDGVGIRSITFTPDTHTIGINTKTYNTPGVGFLSDQDQLLDSGHYTNLFIAYGNLNHTYDNGKEVKVDDELKSSITIFGSNFKPKADGTPIVSYTASTTQTVINTSKYIAVVGTYMKQYSTEPGKQQAGSISLAGPFIAKNSNYRYIYEPIFYYVIPDNAVFSGDMVENLNSNDKEKAVPVVSTYFVNGRQIVKVDYTGTNFDYDTRNGGNDTVILDNASDKPNSTSKWEVYVYSKDIKMAESNKGEFLTAETAEKPGSSVKLDPSKFYFIDEYLYGNTWKISTASAVTIGDAANGNKNASGLYVKQGSSDDKGSGDMNFRVNVVNYDTAVDLHNAIGFVNLPTTRYSNSTLNFSLSRPVDANGQTVLYSTTTTDLPEDLHTKTPSTDNFLTEDQVKEKIAKDEMSWSDIKSIAVKYDIIKANSASNNIFIHGTDKNIAQDAGKIGQLAWGLYGGNGMHPLVNKNASTITVSGTSTVNVRLHYTDTEGKEHYIDVPSMSKAYKDNVDKMYKSDFNPWSVPTNLIPKGYEVKRDSQTIINNGGKTWTTDAPDGSAQFDKTVIYNFDHDTVQFELTPKIDKVYQSMNRIIHFVTDGPDPQKVYNDEEINIDITQATNEITGEKTYTASYINWTNFDIDDLPVTVNPDGQLSITIPAGHIEPYDGYYVVDSTKADLIPYTFTFTANSNSTIENTVKYAPVKQELQVEVYDDDSKKALDTQDTGAKVNFIGNSNAAFPTDDLQTNLDKLKTYYEGKNYIVTLPSASGSFDDTNNGPGKDNDVQVIKVHLKHDTETITSENPKNPDDPINEKDPNGAKYPPEASKSNLAISSKNIVHYEGAGEQTPKDSVVTDDNTLTRTVTIDKVTGDVLETSAWKGEKDYENVATPVVNGYFADKKAAGESKVTTADVERAKDGMITNETTVVYKPMGKIIPIDKNGTLIPNAPTPSYSNDPNDPTKASKTNTPVIPGYHLKKSDETVITPDNPGKDREVVYVADNQKVLVQVYDKDSDTPAQPLDTSKTNVTVSFNGDSFTNFPTGVATSVSDLIKYYESRGYKVENKPTAEELAAKFDGDQTVDQYLKLTLVHGTETITGENPKKVGDPINPADPDSKKYDKQTSKENLVIASEVTIDYDGAGKKTPTKSVRTNDATLTRSVTIDKVTGAVISTSDWTGGANYDAVTTPKISGYTADLETAGKVSIIPADYNDAVNGVITRKFKVVYTPEKQELQLKVYDQDTGKYLDATESFFGVTDQDVDQTVQTSLDKLKEQFTTWGYEIVKTPVLDKTYDNTDNGTSEIDKHPQEFVLVVKHRHEQVTPEDPKTPKDNIPDTNQNYPKGVDEADLTKKITRTIIVHFPDGSTKEISQDVIYVRTATVDVVTKDVTYSEWTSKDNKWPEFKAPDVPGYVPDTAKVDLVLVKDTDTNTKVDIYYTLDTSIQNPDTDTKTDQDTTKPEQNQEINKTNQTEHKTKTKQTHAKKQKTVQSTKTYRAKSASVVNSNKSRSSTPGLVNAPKAKKLPQTNSSSGWQTSLLGVGLLFMSLLGFKKKKKDD